MFKRKKAYTLIELIIVLGILAVISTITALNVNKIKATTDRISLEESLNEARSLLSFGKNYCRKNKVYGMIIINDNKMSFIVEEKDYEIIKSTEKKLKVEMNSNFTEGYSRIDRDGYIKSAGKIVVKKGKYYGEIRIGVASDIIGESEVDIIDE